MLLCKVKKKKKKDRKQLLIISYRLPWGFPENALSLPWESVSDWNFTLVFSKLGASGRYLRGVAPGCVAEYPQLSQSLQVPKLVLQAVGLLFALSTLNLFMCNSSRKAYIKLIWFRIMEWYTFFLVLVWYTAFPSMLGSWLAPGSFPRSKKKGEEIYNLIFFSLWLLPQRWKHTPSFDLAFYSQILSIFPN